MVPRRRCSRKAKTLVREVKGKAVATAVIAGTPSNKVMPGMASAAPPAPVSPTINPTTDPRRTSCSISAIMSAFTAYSWAEDGLDQVVAEKGIKAILPPIHLAAQDG